MKLSVDRINQNSPYWVIQLDDMLFRFVTKNGVKYNVGFYPDKYFLKDGAYHFFISNTDEVYAPKDVNVFKVISNVIEEFFRQEESVMLYICEPKDHREKTRSLLYKRWFTNSQYKECLTLKDVDINFDGYIVYAGMIIRKDHKNYSEIIDAFDKFVKEIPQIYTVNPK